MVRAFSPWFCWDAISWGVAPGWYEIAPLALTELPPETSRQSLRSQTPWIGSIWRHGAQSIDFPLAIAVTLGQLVKGPVRGLSASPNRGQPRHGFGWVGSRRIATASIPHSDKEVFVSGIMKGWTPLDRAGGRGSVRLRHYPAILHNIELHDFVLGVVRIRVADGDVKGKLARTLESRTHHRAVHGVSALDVLLQRGIGAMVLHGVQESWLGPVGGQQERAAGMMRDAPKSVVVITAGLLVNGRSRHRNHSRWSWPGRNALTAGLAVSASPV